MVAEPPAATIVEPQTPLDTQPQTIDVGQILFRDYFVGKFVSEILPSQLSKAEVCSNFTVHC